MYHESAMGTIAAKTLRTTLPARAYTDPAWFQREMEAIYARMWLAAGRDAELQAPGAFVRRDVAGASVLIVRADTGSLLAFHNVCRHRGTRLCAEEHGTFQGRIQCPYHAWTYGLDGRLLAAPHMAPEFRKEEYPLHRAGCEVWDGHIFVHLGQEGQEGQERQERQDGQERQEGTLRGQLADLPDRFAAWRMGDLQLGRRIVYDVKANWKLIVLNFNECLHCPNLHPALNRLHHYLGADNEAPTADYCGGSMGFREGIETVSMDGKRRREYLPGLSESQRQQVAYFAIYPNLLLSLHPDYMMTHTLWPRANDRTEIVCEWHFHPAELARVDFQADDAVELWDLTNREDWWIAEQSQAGINSRAYQPGPYSDREELLWSFDEIVKQSSESS